MSDNFKPQLTPQEMLEMGVFGGWYFEGNLSEYPASWLTKARLSEDGFDVSLNYFGVASGQSLEEWHRKGWITSDDPRGWFQWYCRYTMGRRIPDLDRLQIKRWKAFGPRHIGAIRAHCEEMNFGCWRRQRQALLQWAYDPVF